MAATPERMLSVWDTNKPHSPPGVAGRRVKTCGHEEGSQNCPRQCVWHPGGLLSLLLSNYIGTALRDSCIVGAQSGERGLRTPGYRIICGATRWVLVLECLGQILSLLLMRNVSLGKLINTSHSLLHLSSVNNNFTVLYQGILRIK